MAFVAELKKRGKRERLGVFFKKGLRKQFDLDWDYLFFLEETKFIKRSDWKVASIPNDLLDRQVEITGPVDRKKII
ncbi:MAG: hypothetical protein CM15mP109_12380 [Candidatus Dadabacteria bacterium]|nr:MAG: hypothetical protein CM15mP109_12380 [Candidatus Dadabacteria bacterium]